MGRVDDTLFGGLGALDLGYDVGRIEGPDRVLEMALGGDAQRYRLEGTSGGGLIELVEIEPRPLENISGGVHVQPALDTQKLLADGAGENELGSAGVRDHSPRVAGWVGAGDH